MGLEQKKKRRVHQRNKISSCHKDLVNLVKAQIRKAQRGDHRYQFHTDSVCRSVDQVKFQSLLHQSVIHASDSTGAGVQEERGSTKDRVCLQNGENGVCPGTNGEIQILNRSYLISPADPSY